MVAEGSEQDRQQPKHPFEEGRSGASPGRNRCASRSRGESDHGGQARKIRRCGARATPSVSELPALEHGTTDFRSPVTRMIVD